MEIKISKPFWQAAALGVVAGMRTASAPAIAGQMLSKNPHGAPKFVQSKILSVALKAFAVSEFIVDKLPTTPNRTKVGGVVFRGLSGAIAGAGIFKANGESPLIGAAIGSVVAVGATFGSYFLRKITVEKTGVHDPFIGAVEDAMVLGAGIGLVSTA